MRPLSGQHALVTGANRGIGAAICRRLAAAGANITLMVRDPKSAAVLAAELERSGVRTTTVIADVSARVMVLQACETAVATLGPVDILVNNAGTVETVSFLRTEPELFERMIAVHLMGPVAASQAVLPSMLELKRGRIVNVASIAGLRGAAYVAAYVAAKHAMVGLTRALSVEYAGRGVLVNAVCPGYTDTDLVSESVGRIVAKTGRSVEEAMRTILTDAGQSRLVTTDEVAEAVLGFCLPEISVTGEALELMGEPTA